MNYQALAEAALAQFMTQPGFAAWWNRVIPVTKDELLDELAGALQEEGRNQRMQDLERGTYQDVKSCAACGKDHDSMFFIPMTISMEGFTHWGLCPSKGWPVLMRSLPDKEEFTCPNILVF